MVLEEIVRPLVKWYRDNNGNVIDTVRKNVHSALANYKADTKLYIASVVKGYSNDTNEGGKDRITHWNKLYKKAVKRGEKKSGHNRFGMSDRIYNKNYKEKVKKKQENINLLILLIILILVNQEFTT